ncbi:MAG: FHA domain-containing protein, partial [Planctomycetales bacterium]|nr:FHA domain-containing protein [Planctomycetales bacterium]
MPILRQETGLGSGRTFRLGGEPVLLGRHPDCGVRLADPQASRRHARFGSEGGEPVLTDLGSSNGTRVNGRRIPGPHSLSDGDVVEVGQTRFRYVREESGGAAERPSTDDGAVASSAAPDRPTEVVPLPAPESREVSRDPARIAEILFALAEGAEEPPPRAPEPVPAPAPPPRPALPPRPKVPPVRPALTARLQKAPGPPAAPPPAAAPEPAPAPRAAETAPADSTPAAPSPPAPAPEPAPPPREPVPPPPPEVVAPAPAAPPPPAPAPEPAPPPPGQSTI